MPDDSLENSFIGSNYLVQGRIAAGGMSVVYKAQHQGTGEVVAVKVLSKEFCGDERTNRRFCREANALIRLKHPGLVSILEVGVTTTTGQPFFIMEFLQGRTLADILSERSVVAPDRAVPLFMQICDAMYYAHQNGIVHRDLKPENIMLLDPAGQNPRAKVLDFGILKLDDSKQDISQRLTDPEFVCGSPYYMSPEQAADKGVDHRTDIYALGAVLYRTLVGVPPFEGDHPLQILYAHRNKPVRPFGEVRAEMRFYPSLEVIVMQCLEKSKETRYQTMAQLKEDLAVFYARIGQEIAAVIAGYGLRALPPLPYGRPRSR